ncbi:hypothetical protein [Tumebacillus permanentifrigoris]|uniref:Uncharacterized protein n=1 Tax=Tumebacillus permanentifrigoris TaxID=378543 RepID=A0A316D8L9_9BACL|nr:hypothetical protein [Tumebacillus permanentifrigoris]PWK13146.1 hypothetical protein C7459_108166 [Tumebacillus permanentifrigoris]
MNLWNEISLTTWETAVLTVCLWFLCYGLNVPVRAWQMWRNAATHEVLERVTVVRKSPRQPRSWTAMLRGLYVSLVLLGLMRIGVRWEANLLVRAEYESLMLDALLGAVIGAVVSGLLWLFYRTSKTVHVLELHFDREGVTIYPVRQNLLAGQGIYETRVQWKDCYGYWVFKGYFVLAMRPIGQVEQFGGSKLEQIEPILYRLGVRKLVSYDMREAGELSQSQLLALNDRVQKMADEVIAGYAAECAMLGVQICADVEQRHEEEQFSVLVLRSVVAGETVSDIEWLLWGEDGKTLETLGLADDRLYEGIDERVASLLEARQQEIGQDVPQVLYQ